MNGGAECFSKLQRCRLPNHALMTPAVGVVVQAVALKQVALLKPAAGVPAGENRGPRDVREEKELSRSPTNPLPRFHLAHANPLLT
jgi:hypothetical protein